VIRGERDYKLSSFLNAVNLNLLQSRTSTITLLVDPEYQDHGVIYLRISNFQPTRVTVRLYAIRFFLSEILISVDLSTKVCRTAHSLDPRRTLAAVRVVTPHPNIKFVVRVEDCIENFIPILFHHILPVLRPSTVIQGERNQRLSSFLYAVNLNSFQYSICRSLPNWSIWRIKSVR
jgi:hypothetical protein